MNNKLPLVLLTLFLLSGVGCKKYTGEKAAAQRQEWLESLRDSITAISAQRSADSLRLEELRSQLSDEIGRFTQVANAREVEPYYILSQFKAKYPLSSTGIAARLMNNEQVELIAALSGKHFNAIRINAGGASVTSQTVPADQALNYTSGGLTTVAFTGPQADSICEIVNSHKGDQVKLEYLQNGGIANSINLTADQKEWIAGTWDVCGAHLEARRLENNILISGRKIEILKITLAQETAKVDANNNK